MHVLQCAGFLGWLIDACRMVRTKSVRDAGVILAGEILSGVWVVE